MKDLWTQMQSMPKTDPELLKKIEEAVNRNMTAEEAFEQRVSFVYSAVGKSGLSKDQVREFLSNRGEYPKHDHKITYVQGTPKEGQGAQVLSKSERPEGN